MTGSGLASSRTVISDDDGDTDAFGHAEGPRTNASDQASHVPTGAFGLKRNDAPRQGPTDALGGDREAGPASSLVLCSESVGENGNAHGFRIEGVGRICPKRPQLLVCDQDARLRRPATCDAYRCQVCGPRKAVQAAAVATWAIRHADRARFITLTNAPETHQERRHQIRDLAYRLRADGLTCEWAWTVEKGKKTGMTHVHLLQHGSYVPQGHLQDRWGARVDIRAVRTGGVARYVTKDALRVAGYVVKGADATLPEGGLDAFLDLNGGRAMHWSRGFLHGVTKRQALGLMTGELGGSEDRTWHLEPAITF